MEGLSSYNFSLFYHNNKYYAWCNHQHINYHSKIVDVIKSNSEELSSTKLMEMKERKN